MTESQLLKYCLFYKGETLPPVEFNQTNAGKLWQAEKYICENLANNIAPDSPALEMATLVEAYVGKWAPFSANEVMSQYWERCPDEVRSKLF